MQGRAVKNGLLATPSSPRVRPTKLFLNIAYATVCIYVDHN
jgi:hypothetical protein